jgi:bifunctional non-homologous end joining protein LigD
VRHAGVWAPKELRQFRIASGTGSGTTMIADDAAGLVALAQMNVLEIHAWNARVANLDLPDRMVFDLDPGPLVAWPAVVAAAVRVRAILEEFELASFVKTTGSKGLHVVVPLQPHASWADTIAFSHDVAQALAHDAPERYSAVLTKAGREDKIFIDYLRNRRGATSVSVYSTRARPGAPVSVPVAWEALGADTRSDSFRVSDRAGWLAGRRADPWAAYHRTRQRLVAKHLTAAKAVVQHLARSHRARR